MAHSLVLEESVVMPIPAAEAFQRTLSIPLPELFKRWHVPFPPVKEVRGQTGEWGTPGQTRTVALTGGGGFREELTSVDPPQSFGYRLTDITGPMALLAGHVDGNWSFTPAGGGTEVTWRWVLHPKSPLTSWLLPAVGRRWNGYARQALQGLSTALTASR